MKEVDKVAMKKALGIVKRRRLELARLRNNLRSDINDLNDLDECCEEAFDSLGTAIEALSKYV